MLNGFFCLREYIKFGANFSVKESNIIAGNTSKINIPSVKKYIKEAVSNFEIISSLLPIFREKIKRVTVKISARIDFFSILLD